MKGWIAAASLLPEKLRQTAEMLSAAEKARCEEIRLRRGYPLSLRLGGREVPLGQETITEAMLRAVMELATRSSFHAVQDEMVRGFISAPGGVRVGVCGEAALSGERMIGFRTISSLSLRIPREVIGCADELWSELGQDDFPSLLILSAPGAGKTTLLRELVRKLSESGRTVAVADERDELGGSGGFDLGAHTDVMTGVPKAQAVLMLLRAMNPSVVAVDEVTDPEDAQALLHAAGSGVRLLATMHASGIEDMTRRPGGRLLLESEEFSRCVMIESRGGCRRYRVESIE